MKVACLLVTHLPMKAELRRRPDLRGKPVVIAGGHGSRQAVVDRSRDAVGVMAGMPLLEALSRCKDAVLLQADEVHYRAAFDGIVASLARRSPLVESAALGCAYVGLDGLEAMYGGEARLITSLLQAVPSDFNARVGLAGGKFPAYVAAVVSGGGQATRVPDDGVGGFLAPLPIDLLPLSWENKVRLRRFGIRTMGEVASLPLGSVQAQLGPEGRAAWKLASGMDDSPLLPDRAEEEVSEFLTFPSPVSALPTVLPAVETLLGRAFARPALRGRYAREAAMESAVLRRPPWTRRFAFKDAVNSKDKAFFALKSMLETVAFPGALEDMRLTLAGLTGESGVQGSLLVDVRRQEQLREMMDGLEARLGDIPPVYRVREVEPWSRVPERQRALVRFDP